jgi:hypothetical protein
VSPKNQKLVLDLRRLEASHPHYKSYALEAAREIQRLETRLRSAEESLAEMLENQSLMASREIPNRQES